MSDLKAGFELIGTFMKIVDDLSNHYKKDGKKVENLDDNIFEGQIDDADNTYGDTATFSNKTGVEPQADFEDKSEALSSHFDEDGNQVITYADKVDHNGYKDCTVTEKIGKDGYVIEKTYVKDGKVVDTYKQ